MTEHKKDTTLFTVYYYFLRALYCSESCMKNFRGIITWDDGLKEGEMEIQKTTSLSVYMYACIFSIEQKTMLQSVFMIPVHHHIIMPVSGPCI